MLLDKEHRAGAIPAPTGTRFVPAPPTADEFDQVIANLLVGMPYIAKSLLRRDLLAARWVLDEDVRFGSLIPMLWWRVESDHEWRLPTRQLGRGLQDMLHRETWDDVLATFAPGDVESTWEAALRMLWLFRRVTREVAECLGLDVPEARFDAVEHHTRRMRAREFG